LQSIENEGFTPQYLRLILTNHFIEKNMESKKTTDLTEEELMEKEQKLKKGAKTHAFMLGLLGGVVVYSLVKNGLVWPTFFPLVIIAFLEKRRRDEQKALQTEIESRKSQ
jgi:hypothetical protein